LPALFRYGDWVRTTEPLTIGKTTLPAGVNGTVTLACGDSYIVEFAVKDTYMAGGYRFETALIASHRLVAVPPSEEQRARPRRGPR
jgi:hypothetical protein